ncbi:MAG: ATP-binding cassette domain-containing protein [Acidimicrobiales bacterium]
MTDAAIVAVDLAKHYGPVVALDGVSLEVPAGTVLGLLGPNGAGKTTTVRILTTLLKPDRGHASVLGLDVALEPQRVRASIGLAGQYAAVDENLTARENLRLMGRLTHIPKADIPGRSAELLAQFNLTDAADRPIKTFSGGMRRRLDLAAALVHRPPVLFLDEPTTGLDPRSRTDMWGVIEELVSGGVTVLLTTQYLEEADRLADNIIVIDGGKLIAEGTAAELKARLGSTVIEVGMSDPAAARQAAVALEGLCRVAVDGATVTLKVDDGAHTMVEAVRRLDRAHLEPASLGIREPTLDDVFLTLTGHGATAEPTSDFANGRRSRRAQKGAA